MTAPQRTKAAAAAPTAHADPAVEWVDITPDVAAQWLRLNTLNRPKRQRRTAIYAADMKSGHWPITGATICFGRSGRLLDGQNRLQAIVDSGATIRMLVVHGLEDGIFDVIDGGARRTSTDVLVIEGYDGWLASCGATAARLCINLQAGCEPYSRSFSPQNIRRFVNDWPDLMSSVEFVGLLPRRPAPLPHSAGAALHFFFCQRDVELADELLTQLYRGDGMPAEHMVLRLRNNLLGRAQQKLMTTPAHFTQAMIAVIRVWNAARQGRNIAHISNAFRASNEPFPVIQ